MHVVRVFAASWGPETPLFLRIPNSEILGAVERWVMMPADNNRIRVEARETTRLRESPIDSYARRRTAAVANAYYRREPTATATADAQRRQDIRWTAQSLNRRNANDGYDELLYRTYAKNLDVFGEKAERDLYILALDDRIAKYGIEHRGPAQSTVRLRAFAVLKEAAYPSIADFDSTWFTPIISIVGVVSSNSPQPGKFSDLLDLSLAIEEAYWDDTDRRIDSFLLDIARDRLAVLRGPNWGSLRSQFLTQFSAFVIGLDDAAVSRDVLLGEQRLPPRAVAWRQLFLSFAARLCIPTFHGTEADFGYWVPGALLRWGPDLARATLPGIVEKLLPVRSRLLIADDVVSVVTPGRKMLLRFLTKEQVGGIRRDLARTQNHSNPHSLLDSVAWNSLLLSLATMQEALIARFHSMLSDDGDIAGVRQALRDFDDFYDIEMFDLPNGGLYQDSFNAIKHALDLDHQYKMLHRKMEITVSDIHASNLKWAIVSFLFLAFMTLDWGGGQTLKWAIVGVFAIIAVTYVVLMPMWGSMRILFAELPNFVMSAPRLLAMRVAGVRRTD